MARSVRRAGHTVRVWNRSREKALALEDEGTTATETAAEAVAEADVVITMLFDLSSTRLVVAEAADAFAAGAVWIQTATVGVAGAADLADLAGRHRISMLDAPVLGTKKPAADGDLVVLGSGDPALRRGVEPVLEAIARKTIWAGDQLGAGSALKLACNAWIASITAATAQSLALAARLDLDPQLFLDAIADGPTDSPYAQLKGAAMLAADYTPSFPVSGVLKDLGLIVAAAERAGVPTRILTAVRETFADSEQAGHGGSDLAAVYEAISPAEH